MRDGVALSVDVYRPAGAGAALPGPFPALLERTPYGKRRPVLNQAGEYFARDGYVVVMQDVRGRWMSEGTFENIRPQLKPGAGPTDIDESTDTYDTIDGVRKAAAVGRRVRAAGHALVGIPLRSGGLGSVGRPARAVLGGVLRAFGGGESRLELRRWMIGRGEARR